MATSSKMGSATLSGVGLIEGRAYFPSGSSVSLAPFAARAYSGTDVAEGRASLAALTSEARSEIYQPPHAVTGYSNMPIMGAAGIMVRSRFGGAFANMSPFITQASEGAYSFTTDQRLHAVTSIAFDDSFNFVIPTGDCIGAVGITEPRITGAFGAIGAITVDEPVINASASLLPVMDGSFSIEEITITGSARQLAVMRGDYSVDDVAISGTLLGGHLVTGSIDISEIDITGHMSLNAVGYGFIDLAEIVITGHTDGTLSDDTISYTRGSDCQL